jgi:hypothetical protein
VFPAERDSFGFFLFLLFLCGYKISEAHRLTLRLLSSLRSSGPCSEPSCATKRCDRSGLNLSSVAFRVVFVSFVRLLVFGPFMGSIAEGLILGETAHTDPNGFFLWFNFQGAVRRFKDASHGNNLILSSCECLGILEWEEVGHLFLSTIDLLHHIPQEFLGRFAPFFRALL